MKADPIRDLDTIQSIKTYLKGRKDIEIMQCSCLVLILPASKLI